MGTDRRLEKHKKRVPKEDGYLSRPMSGGLHRESILLPHEMRDGRKAGTKDRSFVGEQ